MLTLDEVKRQLRLPTTFTGQDDELRGFVTDAAAWVERYTGHTLTARDVTQTFRVPGRRVTLDAWPIAADAVPEITYPGALGAPVPIVGASLDVSGRPARLLAPADGVWPLTSTDQLLTVTVRAGYEDAQQLPGDFRRAMLILVTAFNEDRAGGDVLRKAEETAARLCNWAQRLSI